LGKPEPPPHAVKRALLRRYSRRNHIHTLIETGTFYGDMVCALKNEIPQILTIELDERLHLLAQRRFRRAKNIRILQGDSATLLPALLADVTVPCLFWLDAHYSGPHTARAEQETPIVKELTAILSHHVGTHVVLIDDARCFNGTQDYPPIQELETLVQRFPYRFSVSCDVIRLEPLGCS
jgi:hypothetical protein